MSSLLDHLFRLVVSDVPQVNPRVDIDDTPPPSQQAIVSTPSTKSKSVRSHTDTPRPAPTNAYRPPSIQIKNLPPTPATPAMSVSSVPMDLETPDNSHDRMSTSHMPMTSFPENSRAFFRSAGPAFHLPQAGCDYPPATTSSAPAFSPLFARNASFPVIIRRPDDYHEPIREVPEHEQDASEQDPRQGWQMSRWRSDQIKYMKRARKGPNQTPKPIPTLHGPLSLPYARNPSGVDATIADESAHMSHVFGLRAVSNPTSTTFTDSSGPLTVSITDTSRSASGGHALYMAPKRSADTTAPNAKSEVYKAASQTQKMMVVRDPYQRIGIKQGVLPPLAIEKAKERAKNEVEMALIKKPTSVPIILSRPPTESTEVKDSAPTAGTFVPPSAMLRAQINLAAPKLDPIPGSPSIEEPDPFRALYETNTSGNEASLHRLKMSELQDNRTSRTRESSLPVHMDGFCGVEFFDNVGPANENPLSMSLGHGHKGGANYRESSVESTSSEVEEAGHPVRAQQTPQSASKADTSKNWRVKPFAYEETQTLPAVVLTSPTASPPSTKPSESAAYRHQSVMTIDSLFEKFGHGPQDKHEKLSSITFNPPIESVMKETSKLQLASSNGKMPLGESTANNIQTPSKPPKLSVHVKPPTPRKSSPAISKLRTTNAKGTPGAGKLLKQPAAPAAKTESMPPMPVEANVGGRKLKPARA